ncbi:MAG: RNA polymerase subunit sigma-70 [Planctomycetes bacterium]|nr:RNA polymerase subunit sigma-70 [Planctomycetota bacterium]
MDDITQLLRRASGGDKEALDRVVTLVFEELRARARMHLAGERPGHTLTPTALVNEAYLRLVGEKDVPYQDRRHFFAIASRKMRQILVNHAKHRAAHKRGGERMRVSLDESRLAAPEPVLDLVDLLALDEALSRLESRSGEHARRISEVVEMRLFGGRSAREIAECLGVAVRTVERDLKTGIMVLLHDLSEGSRGD